MNVWYNGVRLPHSIAWLLALCCTHQLLKFRNCILRRLASSMSLPLCVYDDRNDFLFETLKIWFIAIFNLVDWKRSFTSVEYRANTHTHASKRFAITPRSINWFRSQVKSRHRRGHRTLYRTMDNNRKKKTELKFKSWSFKMREVKQHQQREMGSYHPLHWISIGYHFAVTTKTERLSTKHINRKALWNTILTKFDQKRYKHARCVWVLYAVWYSNS